MKARYVVLVAALSVLVAMGALWALLAGKDSGRTAGAAAASDAKDALLRMHAATAGNPDARVHIVEFLDPACETCREFYPLVKKLMAAEPELAWAQLGSLGLDLDRLGAEMESPVVVQNVAVDLQDAKALKVTKTPEYFVNGKPLPSFGYEQLQQLVAQSLAAAYR
jgi:protein-disulfide isomerase